MLDGLKALFKPYVPAPLLSRWRRFRFEREQSQVRGRALEDVFNEIYTRGTWVPAGQPHEIHSGPGSLPGVSADYEAFVANYIENNPSISTLVDIGCGDFQVSQRLLSRIARPIRYIGCDIASVVVERNSQRHGVPGRIEFRQLNVARDPLPDGDIVTVREVFQHLSNETIAAALKNLSEKFSRAIVTEAVPLAPAAPNLDIASGYRTRDGLNSGVFLDRPPYQLTVLAEHIKLVSPHEALRTLVVQL